MLWLNTNFGESLEAMIRDRLVCGINDDAIQKRLLAEGDKLSFAKAVSLAQSYESAVRDATVLLPVEQTPVHNYSQGVVGNPDKQVSSPRNLDTGVAKQDTCQVLVDSDQSVVTFARKLGISRKHVEQIQTQVSRHFKQCHSHKQHRNKNILCLHCQRPELLPF